MRCCLVQANRIPRPDIYFGAEVHRQFIAVADGAEKRAADAALFCLHLYHSCGKQESSPFLIPRPDIYFGAQLSRQFIAAADGGNKLPGKVSPHNKLWGEKFGHSREWRGMNAARRPLLQAADSILSFSRAT